MGALRTEVKNHWRERERENADGHSLSTGGSICSVGAAFLHH